MACNRGTAGPTLTLIVDIFGQDPIEGEPIPLKPQRSPDYQSDSAFSNPGLNFHRDLSSRSISTASPATIGLAKQWILECESSHKKCRKGKSKRLPTRLINVELPDHPGQVQVVETRGFVVDIEYATLSYCWGGEPTIKLTSSNKDELFSGLPIEKLPKTIQDSIQLTHKLGLKWLWVDSLCIIQDCKEDWRIESTYMCDVYQNSFITIAALGALSSSDGLYSWRDALLYANCFLFQTDSGEEIYADNCPIILDRGIWPLHRRGWVTQERIFPPRTLNFGTYLTWECREQQIDEYNILPNTYFRMGFDELKGPFFDTILDQRLVALPWKATELLVYKWWSTVAQIYLGASLTVKSDRLFAIYGVIQSIQRRTGWTNVEGLWEPFLWMELLWEVDDVVNPGDSTGLKPTWSWTATSGAVIWPTDEPNEGFYLNRLAHVLVVESSVNNNTTQDEICKPLSISCKPIKLGRLFRHGQDYRVRGARAELIDFAWKGRGRCTFDTPITESVSGYKEYTELDQLSERGCHFLPIAAGRWVEYGVELLGLLASPSSMYSGAFERVPHQNSECTYTECAESTDSTDSHNAQNPQNHIIFSSSPLLLPILE